MSMGGSLRGRHEGAPSPGAPSSVPWWSLADLQVVGGDLEHDGAVLHLEEEDALRLDVAVLREDDLLGDGVVDRP